MNVLLEDVDGSARQPARIAHCNSTPLARLHLGRFASSACPLSSPDGRQNQYIPMIVSDQERSDQVIKLLIFLGHLVTSPLGHCIFNVRSNSIRYFYCFCNINPSPKFLNSFLIKKFFPLPQGARGGDFRFSQNLLHRVCRLGK